MFNTILSAILLAITSTAAVPSLTPVVPVKVLASHEISLENRAAGTFVNNVFKENILLTIAYGRKIVPSGQAVNWDEVNKPFHYAFELAPGKTFAFHNMVMPKYDGTAQPWNEIHYYTSEGFLSDGWLIGDGVCHLASIMAWVAKDAGLSVEAPTNHNFAAIPQISKENGVAIYYDPNNLSVSGQQNLYITNNKGVPLRFVFDYDGANLKFAAEELL